MDLTTTNTNSIERTIPSEVRVGPLRLKIVLVEDPAAYLQNYDKDDDNPARVYGALVHKDQTIYLREDQAPDMLADTLWHEINHAVWQVVGGWSWDIEEERVVSMITGIQMDTLRRNPELAKYIAEIE